MSDWTKTKCKKCGGVTEVVAGARACDCNNGASLPPKEEVENAMRQVRYKYFGDYEFTDKQHEAVETLCKVACKLYGVENPYAK